MFNNKTSRKSKYNKDHFEPTSGTHRVSADGKFFYIGTAQFKRMVLPGALDKPKVKPIIIPEIDYIDTELVH